MSDDGQILGFFEEAPHIELNLDGSIIGLENWNQPRNRNWSFRHATEIFPFTTLIARGTGEVGEFGARPRDLREATTHMRGRPMRFDEFLQESHCDAFMVLKNNEIVYEDYRRMDPDDVHMLQSSSKTTMCAVIGNLIDEGLIDLEQTIDHYVPDVSSGYTGVSIQDVMDMNVGLEFSEDFSNPESDIVRYDQYCGLSPDVDGVWDRGLLDYIKTIESSHEPGGDGGVRYSCTNTDLLGCIVEAVCGRPYTRVFAENVYQHIGAEADAIFVTDSKGAAIVNGGLSMRLRDFARYAQTFTSGVARDGVRIFSDRWIRACLSAEEGTNYYIEGTKYHNQMITDGECLFHGGLGGQLMYVNPSTEVVVLEFGTMTMPSCGDLDSSIGRYRMARSIDKLLS